MAIFLDLEPGRKDVRIGRLAFMLRDEDTLPLSPKEMTWVLFPLTLWPPWCLFVLWLPRLFRS
jgi:hypothetical protein